MAKMRTVAVSLMMLLCIIPLGFMSADAEPEEPADGLLVDYGNGDTEWYDIGTLGKLSDVFDAALPDKVDYVQSGDSRRVVSVNGVKEVDIGTSYKVQTCSWRIYSWNSVEWEFITTDANQRYTGGDIALGFYPNDATIPVSNPEYREVWTCYKGDSSSSGVSDSFGPTEVNTPLEWYQTYSGGVDATLLYADGMIYHTVAGRYGSVGMDALAKINCLDPVNKTLLWTVNYSNSGNIEITTPLILGDLILVTSGNWHIYCLDRFTGEPVAELVPKDDEGDMCSGKKVTEYIVRKNDPSVSSDRIHVESGVTNAVYENGALYFNTADGLIHCYSIDRENGFQEIWSVCPTDEYRGCYYFYPPVLASFGETRCLLSGNYLSGSGSTGYHGGSLICINAQDGTELWSKTVTDLDGKRVGQVSAINECSDGRVLVCYSGGEMSSVGGGIMLISLEDGSVIWQKDIRCGKPVVYGERFYTYVTAVDGDKVRDSLSGEDVQLQSGYCSFWVDDFSLLWERPTDALTTGGITYCGGKLYSMDYSPGTEGALGGAVWCIDSDTGDIEWKVKVSPYSGNAYSMCSPTVVDGKVLVGNDYGAIYVLSEKTGTEVSHSSEINYMSQGLTHWSWVLLMLMSVAIVAVSVYLYRK